MYQTTMQTGLSQKAATDKTKREMHALGYHTKLVKEHDGRVSLICVPKRRRR